MTTSNDVAAGSTARYKPFGGYRTTPTNNDTDIGFTGHKDNAYIKLVYMNARFYSPLTGRFISADTIVPNPTDPQSLNRYSYTRNNPINRIDPTGHVDCSLLGEASDIEGCNNPVLSIEQQVAQGSNVYGIIFAADAGESWTAEEMVAALRGVADVALRLKTTGHFGGADTGGVFQQVFGTVTFLRSSKTQWTDRDGVVHDIDYGAQAFGNRVEFYDLSVGVDPLDPNFKFNVVHELGHVFNHVTNENSDANPYAILGNALGNDLPSRDTLRRGMNPYPYQQNTRGTRNENYELFADSFLNWTYRSFNSTDRGRQTSNWFEAQMSLWVAPGSQ